MDELTVNRVLAHPLIMCTSTRNLHGVYSVRLGVLRTEILILVNRSTKRPGRYNFKISHAIKTPLQGSACRTVKRGDRSEARALRHALSNLIRHYRQATGAGLSPGEHWLVWQP